MPIRIEVVGKQAVRSLALLPIQRLKPNQLKDHKTKYSYCAQNSKSYPYPGK